MLKTRTLLLAAAMAATLLGAPQAPAFADSPDPLFINVTTDDAHRLDMAFTFGDNQFKRGHPLTIFINDKAVLAASKLNADKFAAQQKTLADLLSRGVTILVCPMCMKYYGVKPEDLLPGLKTGNPELTGAALFRDDTKTLTW